LSSYSGNLVHACEHAYWVGRQGFEQGDTMGLLLDCGAGHLVVYNIDSTIEQDKKRHMLI
jgi:hypothetical protein